MKTSSGPAAEADGVRRASFAPRHDSLRSRPRPADRPGTAWPWLLGAATVLLPVAAQAQLASQTPPQSPAYVGASQSVNRDSNVFRAADGQARSDDVYYATSLLGGFDLRPGRQRVYGVGSVSRVKFRDNDQLDHVSYALNAGVDWETVNNLSGKLDIVRNRGLADYAGDGDPRVFDKNLETAQQLTAIARVGVVTRLTLEGQLQHRDVSYSSPLFDFREFDQDSASFNVRHQFSQGLSAAAGVRYTRGRYPAYTRDASGAAVADDYDRRDIDLLVDWTPSGKSTVSGRLSYGKQDAGLASANDFSGLTGAVTWTYQPTGKLQFVTLLVRDTGAESRFVNFGPSETSRTDTSRLSSTAKLAVRYEATAKIQVTGSAQYTHRSLRDSVLQTGAPGGGRSGTDDWTRLEAGVRYLPLRAVALQCNVAHERRRTDTMLSYAYRVNAAGCVAQVSVNVL